MRKEDDLALQFVSGRLRQLAIVAGSEMLSANERELIRGHIADLKLIREMLQEKPVTALTYPEDTPERDEI